MAPQSARETNYFQDNIGKVKTVEDFLKNARLFTYAMKAHGLDDMINAKAFMRKVLLSDLSKGDSFANKLVDQRFVAFAAAFNFSPTGGVVSGVTLAQESAQQAETEKLYSEQRIRSSIKAAAEVDYYTRQMPSIQSVDDLLGNKRLSEFILRTFDINPTHASLAAIKSVLTSDLSDPTSVANSMGPQYRALAAACSFDQGGAPVDGMQAQTPAQISDTIFRFYDKAENRATSAAAKFRSDKFVESLSAIGNVDDLLNNDRSYAYMLTAVGLDPLLEIKADVRAALLRDPSDPNSKAKTSAAYLMLHNAFNFSADGSIELGAGVQTSIQQSTLIDSYIEHYDDKAVRNETSSLEFYRSLLKRVKTTTQFVNTPAIWHFALKAFDFDPATTSKSQITRVLQSDPSDPSSYVKSLPDKRYRALADAFNFGPDGTARGTHRAQLDTSMSETVARYRAVAVSNSGANDLETADTKYYVQAVSSLQTVDELLQDRKVVRYIGKAYGFKDEELKSAILKRALISNPLDMSSFVNTTSDPRLRSLAAAFNFDADGRALQIPTSAAHDRDEIIRTVDGYLRNSIEADAGERNVGVRLALYFQRKAPTITTAYQILADKALFQVVRTTLGLPETMIQSDIDKQASMITRKLDLADLKDPITLDKFIARFASLYDLSNKQSSAPILSLLQTS